MVGPFTATGVEVSEDNKVITSVGSAFQPNPFTRAKKNTEKWRELVHLLKSLGYLTFGEDYRAKRRFI